MNTRYITIVFDMKRAKNVAMHKVKYKKPVNAQEKRLNEQLSLTIVSVLSIFFAFSSTSSRRNDVGKVLTNKF